LTIGFSDLHNLRWYFNFPWKNFLVQWGHDS